MSSAGSTTTLSSRDHVFFDFRHNWRSQVKNNYFGNGITGTTLLRENFGGTTRQRLHHQPDDHSRHALQLDALQRGARNAGAAVFAHRLWGSPAACRAASYLLQMPFIGFSGSCGSMTSYQCLGDTGSALDPTTSYQFFTDVVKVLGNHTLKVGFDGRQYRLSVQNFGDSSGSFTFGTNFVTGGSSSARAAVRRRSRQLLLRPADLGRVCT